jgi:hypothetical protein
MRNPPFATAIGFVAIMLITGTAWGMTYECVQFFLNR